MKMAVGLRLLFPGAEGASIAVAVAADDDGCIGNRIRQKLAMPLSGCPAYCMQMLQITHQDIRSKIGPAILVHTPHTEG